MALMAPYVEPLDLADIETGAAGLEAQYLFRTWRENEGLLIQDERLTKLASRLMTLRPTAEAGDVPPISFLGKETPFRKYFPEADSGGLQPTSLLPASYKKSIAHGYHAAINGEPWYDLQRTGSALGEDKPDLLIDRFILLFRTNAGFERLFCLTTERHSCERSTQSNRRYHQLSFRQKSSWHPAYQAKAVPSELHGMRPL